MPSDAQRLLPRGAESSVPQPLALVPEIEGILEDAISLDDSGANFVWAADRAWCPATEVDHAWTHVGGSRGCIDTFLSTEDLEALEAWPWHRADAGGTWASRGFGP